MRTSDLWQALEGEATDAQDALWLTRHATPDQGYPLLIAIDPRTLQRALLLPASRATMPPRSEWPECRGLDVMALAVDGAPHLAVLLVDPAASDVFSVLADDVAPRITSASSSSEAVEALLDRLRRWQQFLSATHTGLTLERERGLWGELYVLSTHMLDAIGARPSVSAWKAYNASHQDFQFPTGSVEIKTTAAKQPQSIRITSERQLDSAGVGHLFLHVVVVDEREVEAEVGAPGESLPGLISALRAELSGDSTSLGLFNDRLLELGYLDAQRARYECRRRTVRREYTYEVHRDFPRITESTLPAGIGDVSYALDLNACAPHSVDVEQMLAKLH